MVINALVGQRADRSSDRSLSAEFEQSTTSLNGLAATCVIHRNLSSRYSYPMKQILSLAVLLIASFHQQAFSRVHESDICVFGGTSGGVVAAVQASRMGKRVILAEPGRHLGGMTSGGLSAVDIGDPGVSAVLLASISLGLSGSMERSSSGTSLSKAKGGPLREVRMLSNRIKRSVCLMRW